MPLPKNSNRITTKNRSFIGDPKTYWKKDGPPLWEYLCDEILDRDGKILVSTDPGLSENTMRALKKKTEARRKVNMKAYDLQLGDPNDPSKTDTGMALLSSCISDNTNATMAELVTRIAAICGFPFYEVAVEVIAQYESEEGLFRFDHVTHEPIPWKPRQPGQAIPKPSFDRKTDVEDEWAMLSAEFS